MISILNNMNSELHIRNVTDERFKKYGRILDSKLFEDAFLYLNDLSIPITGNEYIAHDQHFQDSLVSTAVYDDVFGYVDLQFGYVNGKNEYLNALEYHKSSEINICATPLVLFLGVVHDITKEGYDSKNLEVFYIPKGTVIELHPGVLHFSPCRVNDEGFRCGVILPMGTNQDFVKSTYRIFQENELLFKNNKWLIAHFENETLLAKGAYPGLHGKNYKINY